MTAILPHSRPYVTAQFPSITVWFSVPYPWSGTASAASTLLASGLFTLSDFHINGAIGLLALTLQRFVLVLCREEGSVIWGGNSPVNRYLSCSLCVTTVNRVAAHLLSV